MGRCNCLTTTLLPEHWGVRLDDRQLVLYGEASTSARCGDDSKRKNIPGSGRVRYETVSFAVVALAACAVLAISPASAQDMSKKISPSMIMQMAPAIERTPEQMDAFDAAAVPTPEREEPAPRPTMDVALYNQLKQAAALAPRGVRPAQHLHPRLLWCKRSSLARLNAKDPVDAGFRPTCPA